jgi:hypothetical protein
MAIDRRTANTRLKAGLTNPDQAGSCTFDQGKRPKKAPLSNNLSNFPPVVRIIINQPQVCSRNYRQTRMSGN